MHFKVSMPREAADEIRRLRREAAKFRLERNALRSEVEQLRAELAAAQEDHR